MRTVDFLGRFDGVRRTARGWQARCPAHTDKTPSLSITEGERGVLVKCWAGCTTAEIVKALGLTLSDLFYDAPRNPGERVDLSPRPRPFDWRHTTSHQLHRAEALRLRTDRTVNASTGVDLSTMTDEETDAMLNAVADAYADRDVADRLDVAAFTLREQGIQAEREHYARRRASCA